MRSPHILDEQRRPVPVSYGAYLAWLALQPDPDAGNPHVGRDLVQTPKGAAQVSTVFLGFDLSLPGAPKREFFETMITSDFATEAGFLRWPSWEAAELGHQTVVLAIAAGDYPWARAEAGAC